MADAESVRRRLRKLDDIVQRLEALARQPREEFARDRTAQAAAERLLQTAIQIVLDVSAHVLSERGRVDWEEYRQIPHRLAEEGIIPAELEEALVQAAGQRNVLVHLYLEVDPDIVYDTIKNRLHIFREVAEHLLAAVD